MPRLLKSASIEPTRKDVVKSDAWYYTVKITPDIERHISVIIDCITNGKILPDFYYRKNRNSTPDWLLETHGIMHLHLGSPDSRELLFLKQYDTHVYLLCLTDHYPVEEEPPGKTIINITQVTNAKWEVDVDADRKVRAALLNDKIRQGLKPKPR